MEQVVEKNIAARGGLQAWRAVQSLSMRGKMDMDGPLVDYPAKGITIELEGTEKVEGIATTEPVNGLKVPYLMETSCEQ